ncbi:hypothetical protein KC19_VG292300 [Ceratodon purpureus]|uniref:Uncharacterized protein n=1 Tax=Ceratodon purpureus TaxID=3225 RepID=A0A8T0HWL3_CERPU|nr:hypothetical protein KC19_VG292300 [Ceratodon purpureus]
MKKVWHYDLKDALSTICVRIFQRPVYKQGAMDKEPLEQNLADSPSGESIASRPPSSRRGTVRGQRQEGNQGCHTATGSEPGDATEVERGNVNRQRRLQLFKRYLSRRAEELWDVRMKRMSIEEVQEWIGKERLVTVEAMQAEAHSRLRPGPS